MRAILIMIILAEATPAVAHTHSEGRWICSPSGAGQTASCYLETK